MLNVLSSGGLRCGEFFGTFVVDVEHDVVDVDHDDVSAVHHLKDSWGDSIEGRYVFVFVSVCVAVRVCACEGVRYSHAGGWRF